MATRMTKSPFAGKAAIKREQNGTRSGSAEREQARPEGKTETKTQEQRQVELTVTNERMEKLLDAAIRALTKRQVKQHEMILVGREMMRLGAEQFIESNPRVEPRQFAQDLAGDLLQRLLQMLVPQKKEEEKPLMN